MGELWEAVEALENPQLIGVWPTEGYNLEESKGMYDDDHFLGLGLDEDNEPELTDGRIVEWLTQVLQEAGIPDMAHWRIKVIAPSSTAGGRHWSLVLHVASIVIASKDETDTESPQPSGK